MKRSLRTLCAFTFLCLSAILPSHSQTMAVAALNGTVLDPSGAAIPGATVHLHSDDADRDATTDALGRFTLSAPPATYALTVEAVGFSTYSQPALVIAPQHNAALSIKLIIAADTQEVNVSSEPALSNDASSNRSALVLKDDTLDTLSDDPAIMTQQLNALGGTDPSNPPQIYVDGFSNGTLPPKDTIREIRINQNPFTAQFDQFGNGRIEVFTKPGTNKLHGSIQGNFSDDALNARNPFTAAQPSYNNTLFFANVNGPIGKSSSFFFNAQRFDISNNAIIDAVTLDPTLNPLSVSQTIANPAIQQTYSLRFDHQFGTTDTFISRYTFSENSQPNSGIGQLVLSSQAVATDTRTQTLQLTDTHIFNPHVILDSGFQYVRTRLNQNAVSGAPSLIVQGSFSGGGGPSQALHDNLDRFELQQYLSIDHGPHFIRTGLRYRLARDANLATAGTNGQFVFPDIATYRAALAKAMSTGSLGATGASQFSITVGTPSVSLTTGDIGIYAEDEWKRSPNLTLNYGLRIESQSAIPDHFDFAPRLGLAYSIKRNPKAKDPIVVLRGGVGLFYQRFASSNILQSLRQNGTAQQVYFVANPQFYCDPSFNVPCNFSNVPTLPGLSATPPTVYRINPNLRSPMQIQGMVSAEHSFGKFGNMAVSYFQRRTRHQFESLNINAPEPSSGTRPLGGSQNIYQYSSDGVSNGHTLSVNFNINAGKKLSFFTFAAVGHQETDSNGPSAFASNSYNVGADAGRAPGYSPRQIYTGFNAQPGWDTSLNMFLAARSSSNFNITTGEDNNGDTIYNDRPAFATDLSRPSVVHTAYGNFDTDPLPNQTIIPINYGDAPGLVYVELYFNKNFRFGPRPPAPPPPAGAKAATGPVKKEDLPPPRYRLQFGIGADNVLNHINAGPPIGVLSSPFFGRSISVNGSFSNSTAANRAVTLRTAFSF